MAPASPQRSAVGQGACTVTSQRQAEGALTSAGLEWGYRLG